MNARASTKLTNRQHNVLERIDRRVPIKVIASQLGVSEARINQHIRALKDKLQCESMNELVERYRAEFAETDADLADNSVDSQPYSNSLYTNYQLPDEPDFPDQQSRVDPGKIAFADAHNVLIDAPRTESREPVVVPQILDGKHAILYRLSLMLGIAVGVMAAIVLIVSAAVSVSAVLDGKLEIGLKHSSP